MRQINWRFMDFNGLKYKLTFVAEVTDAFLDHLASRIRLKALILVIVGIVLIPGIVLLATRDSGPSAAERALVRAKILSTSGQYGGAVEILMTIKGELRWRPNFGLDLERIRHKGINEALLEEAKIHISDALAQEPRIEIVNIYVRQKKLGSNIIEARVQWQAVTRGNQRSVVLTDVQTTEVEV